MHADNLYDQNEDFAGEKTDLATGKSIDNSKATSYEIDRIGVRTAEDAPIGSMEPDDDTAEEWLRKNDPDHPGYTGPVEDDEKVM